MRYACKNTCERDSALSEQQLATTYLPYVKRITQYVARHLPNHIEKDDLFHAGVIGLIEAFEHFDPRRNTKFLSYANFRIRGAVLSELRDLDLHSRSSRKKVGAFEDACSALERRLGRPPSEEEVAGEMGLSLEKYHHIKRLAVLSVVSLDHQEGASMDDEEALIGKLIDTNQVDAAASFERRELAQRILNAINCLPEQERTVIILYYWEDLLMEEIATTLGVTLSRISQIHRQAIHRLRKNLDKESFSDDLVA